MGAPHGSILPSLIASFPGGLPRGFSDDQEEMQAKNWSRAQLLTPGFEITSGVAQLNMKVIDIGPSQRFLDAEHSDTNTKSVHVKSEISLRMLVWVEFLW